MSEVIDSKSCNVGNLPAGGAVEPGMVFFFLSYSSTCFAFPSHPPPQVRNEFYKDSQGVLLVYDVGLRESFDALDSWLGEMKQEMGSQANMDSIVFIVCANKVRLIPSGNNRLPVRCFGF